MPLDDVYQDLIISNLVAGAVYAHLMTSAFPTLYFDKGYLEGSLMGQLMQETGDTSILHYPAAKQLGSNINIPADAAYLLQVNSGGPYQLNSYPNRAYTDVGGVGLINFVTLQKSLGYTVEAQDNGSQAKLTAPVSLDNKYFAPIAAAYFQYNGFLGVLYYTRPASYSPSSKVWAACWANLTKSSSPLPILDLMQNAGYNSGNGPQGPIINPFIQICAAPVDGSGQPTLAYQSMGDYTLGPAQYLANIGASPNMNEDYPRYPRQIRFYIDELYNNQARMPAGTYTLNNSMPVPIPMLRTIFENSMGTLAYQSGGAGPYGFIAASDAETAFNSALAAANLTDASVLNLNSETDRTQLFALLDTALDNLETNLHFKFTDTTEQDL